MEIRAQFFTPIREGALAPTPAEIETAVKAHVQRAGDRGEVRDLRTSRPEDRELIQSFRYLDSSKLITLDSGSLKGGRAAITDGRIVVEMKSKAHGVATRFFDAGPAPTFGAGGQRTQTAG